LLVIPSNEREWMLFYPHVQYGEILCAFNSLIESFSKREKKTLGNYGIWELFFSSVYLYDKKGWLISSEAFALLAGSYYKQWDKKSKQSFDRFKKLNMWYFPFYYDL
jgi:hypothetical protein